MFSIHLGDVGEERNDFQSFSNRITRVKPWISFILTAGTSENEENILNERGNDMEVDLMYRKLAIYAVLRYLVAIGFV